MKLSVDGLWVHVICVTWNPSLFFVDNNTLLPTNIRPLLQHTIKQTCSICNKNCGYCVKCYKKDCMKCFHVSCAQDHGFVLDAIADEEGVIFTIECNDHKHSTLKSDKDNIDLLSDSDLFDIADKIEDDYPK